MGVYTKPRWGAIALACICAVGTGYVLLEDVIRHGASITTDHVMTVIALVVTIAAGKMFWPELARGRVVAAAFLAVLFVSGTSYVVFNSAARTAETKQGRIDETRASNGDRSRLVTDVDEAKEDLRKANAAAAVACKDGDGPKCKGATKTAAQADSRYWQLFARLKSAKAEHVENAGFKQAARALAALPWVTMRAAALEERLVLLIPFVLAMIAELGSIVFFEIGLPQRLTAKKPANDDAPASATSAAARGQAARSVKPVNEAVSSAEAGERQKLVAEFVAAYQAKHGRAPRTRDVQKACKLPKASASRWRAKAMAG